MKWPEFEETTILKWAYGEDDKFLEFVCSNIEEYGGESEKSEDLKWSIIVRHNHLAGFDN